MLPGRHGDLQSLPNSCCQNRVALDDPSMRVSGILHHPPADAARAGGALRPDTDCQGSPSCRSPLCPAITPAVPTTLWIVFVPAPRLGRDRGEVVLAVDPLRDHQRRGQDGLQRGIRRRPPRPRRSAGMSCAAGRFPRHRPRRDDEGGIAGKSPFRVDLRPVRRSGPSRGGPPAGATGTGRLPGARCSTRQPARRRPASGHGRAAEVTSVLRRDQVRVEQVTRSRVKVVLGGDEQVSAGMQAAQRPTAPPPG